MYPMISACSQIVPFHGSSSQIVPFHGSSGGDSESLLRGVSLQPLGVLPSKHVYSGKTKAWDFNRWNSNGYSNYNEKLLLFGDLDPNPASQDPKDPTVGYMNGLEIQIAEFGKPRDLNSYDVPTEFKTREDASALTRS